MVVAGLRFILFGGKGGVGKTVCAAATGVHLAKLGRRTLVYSVNPTHSLSDCLSQEIGATPTRVAENLDAIEVDGRKLFENLKRAYREEVETGLVSLIRPVDLPFERGLLLDMMDLAPPGLDELMALANLAEIEKTKKYDSIVVDMPAGAHTIRLLALPKALQSWMNALLQVLSQSEFLVRSTKFRSLLEDMNDGVAFLERELSDPEKALFIPVTTPESLSLRVTEDILEWVTLSHIPVRYLVVNQVTRTPAENCHLCEQVMREQSKGLLSIGKKFSGLQAITVPALPTPVQGASSVEMFSRILLEGEEPKGHDTAATRESERRAVKDEEEEVRQPASPSEESHLQVPTRRVRLLIFVGKGGCGKTTSAAAMAIRAADSGRRTLILSTDPQRSLSEVFQQPIGENVVAVRGVENLWAFQVTAEKLYRQFVEKYGKGIAEVISGATYIRESEVMQFLDLSLPGLDEVMALLKLVEVARAEGENYDLIVVDTAPTGHTLRFLEMPELLLSWLRLMFKMRSKSQFVAQAFFSQTPRRTGMDRLLAEMSVGLRLIESLLRSPGCKFVPVTIPEPMAVEEIDRLLSFLRGHRFAYQAVVVNKVFPRGSGCDYCASRAESQVAVLRDFDKLRGRFVAIPLFPHEPIGPTRLRKFARALVG